ncbi:hypothetical protein FRC11_012840 [Ceratobasidium sp. 423]|nr:hypothetical protein FRC11_012840 [Ceratobasidium sp. 423]
MKCYNCASPEGPRTVPPPSNQLADSRRSTAEVDLNDDAILSDLVKLFDDCDLGSETESTSAWDKNPGEQPDSMLETLPKCKTRDVPPEFALASTCYFTVDGFIYGWDCLGWSIFLVDESCGPLGPPCAVGHYQDIPIMGAVFRIDENDVLFRRTDSNQWIQEPLYSTYGDACAALREFTGVHGPFSPPEERIILSTTTPGGESFFNSNGSPPVHMAAIEAIDPLGQLRSGESEVFQPDKDKKSKGNGAGLMGSLNGLNRVAPLPYIPMDEIPLFNEPGTSQRLEFIDNQHWGNIQETRPPVNTYDSNGVDLSTPFLGEGQEPSPSSITQWIESQKGTRPEGSIWLCPLIGCEKVLRRPHALKVRIPPVRFQLPN